MTDFTFTTDDDNSNDERDDDGFSIIQTASIPDTPPKRVTVTMSSTDLKFTEDVGKARSQSYKDGRTADKVSGSQTTESAHTVGASGEEAFIQAYGATPLDESVSATGDGGIDCYIEQDGIEVSVDVKTVDTKYVSRDDDMWIMDKIVPNKKHIADIYVVVYKVDDTTFDICGFARNEDLIKEENIEDSPGTQNHNNYTLRPSDDGWNPVPAPETDNQNVVVKW